MELSYPNDDTMENVRRYLPLVLLFALALILTFHRIPSPQPGVRAGLRPALVQDPSTKIVQTEILGSSPVPKMSCEVQQEGTSPTEARSPVLAGLLWALRHQNEDGSWGDVPVTLGERTIGKTGVTSLVLLSLLGAGYSQLSRDEYDEVVVGPKVKKGLQWLLSQQRVDGTFLSGHDDPFDQALAALALSDAYGMTASQVLKEP